MAKVQIVGLRSDLDAALEQLQRLGKVELASIESEPELLASPLPQEERQAPRADELRALVAELEALLELVPTESLPPGGDAAEAGAVDTGELRAHLEEAAPAIRAAARRREELLTEQATLERYEGPLESVLPLVPELAALDDEDLAALRLDTVALILETEDDALVEVLRELLADELDDRFELAARRTDGETVVCLLAFPHGETRAVHDLLAHEQVRYVALPERYGRLSLRGALEGMKCRLRELPGAVAAAGREVEELTRPHGRRWRAARMGLLDELERVEARALVGTTRRAIVILGWLPSEDLPLLRRRLEAGGSEQLVVEELRADPRDPSAPVLMRNARPARPFEFLVRFLDLPKPGTIDPTALVTLFLPLMFGVMVGDVVYGAILIAIALLVRRRLGRRSPVARDMGRILAVGGAWAVVFGFLYGEALGNFARRYLGMEPLWFYRGSPDALEPLLLFALALGGAHIALGLALGIWQSSVAGRRRELGERIATLMAVAGAFALAGVALEALPSGALTPAAAAIVVGLVVVMSLQGRTGPIVGPIELIGVLGNILSYLRLAAVGLASVYLAIVANEFAVAAPLGIGVIVAALLHALNVALAGFSPMIQSVRLHYVEFFTKFHEGGGRAFRPFGARERTV